MLPNVDIEFVKSVVTAAGDHALEMTAQARHEFKSDNTYVTTLDRETEQFIEKELSARYPDFGFLGEEFGLRGSMEAPFWAVDPIDGTTNYVLGLPLWGVSVGLIYQNEPVLGVIYLPCAKDLFYAEQGGGAFCNGKRIQARDADKPHAEDPLCVTTRGGKQFVLRSWPGSLRSLGTIAGELAYLSRGAFIAMIGHTRTLHDVAAGFCIAREAGCELNYLSGKPIDLMQMHDWGGTREPFLIAAPGITRWVRSHLKSQP